MVSANNGCSENGDEKTPGLKKGPWSAAEDLILKEYVRKHGEGNWNAVQRNCGLLRCGKSCRLRWANHLRPNLKKGCFSPEEERLIIELHAKMGNKWARMASQLPGRTDNEIKNYWNTRVKRLQRAGLPIYPENVPLNYQNNHLNQQTNTSYTISPPAYSPQFNTSMSFLDPALNFQGMHNPPIFFRPNPIVMGSLPTPLNNSIAASFTSPPLNLYGQNLSMSAPFGTFGLLNNPGNTEMSSFQTQTTCLSPSLPASSSTSGCGGYGDKVTIGVQGEGYSFQNDASEERNYNSGLLETVLVESTALAKAKSMQTANSSGTGKGKEIIEDEGSNSGPNLSPFQSSCVEELNPVEEQHPVEEVNPVEELNLIDDDLSRLLDSFPSSSSSQDPMWYGSSAAESVDTIMEQNSRLEIEGTTSENPTWTMGMGSSCWNDMSTIY